MWIDLIRLVVPGQPGISVAGVLGAVDRLQKSGIVLRTPVLAGLALDVGDDEVARIAVEITRHRREEIKIAVRGEQRACRPVGQRAEVDLAHEGE